MIQQSVECKRIGNEYVDLFRKLLQYIHYTNFSKDFITDDDLKMLSELEFYISSGKYEIIEFGTRKSPFDVREKLEELEEKNKTFEDYNKDLNNQLDKLEEENRQTKLLKDRYKLEKENYKIRIDKAIKYIGSITDVKVRYFDYSKFEKQGLHISHEELKKRIKEQKLEGFFIEIDRDDILNILKGGKNE